MAKSAIADIQLTKEEILRYGRHFVLPMIGVDGQKKLKASSVLIIGAGGLGSVAAMYLAGAGVGRLGIADYDNVDLSNLHRQLLYTSADIGKPKVLIAEKKILEINPHTEVTKHGERLTSQNALAILAAYDLVIDGSDNLPTRYLVNDACVMLGKPNVYGAVFQFEGQASVFDARKGPCYRCLFPEPPPPELVPSCAEAGVIGMLPGIIGNVQAVEAVKLIVGFGTSLIGRLILFDASVMDFRELKLEKLSSCPMCGDHPTIRILIDYEEFCGVKRMAPDEQKEMSFQISVQELKQRIDRGDRPLLIDVREPFEYELVRLDARLIPLSTLPDRLSELSRDKEIIVYCHSGVRSSSAVAYLRSNGFPNARNLTGGIDAWAREIDPAMARY